MKAVAFDAMGVLYKTGDDLRQLLVPFARAKGSPLADEQIHAIYRRAMIGEIGTRDLWSELNVAGDPKDLDREYLAGHALVPGIRELLDERRDAGVLLGCISNDVGEWSVALRRAHGLDRWITHWTISSEIRARKPDEAIYRAFLASTGLVASDVTFIDDRVANVDAAAALGFRALLVDFSGTGQDARALRSVEDLRRTIAENLWGGGP